MPIIFTVLNPECVNDEDVVKVQELIIELFKSGVLTEIRSETIDGDIYLPSDTNLEFK